MFAPVLDGGLQIDELLIDDFGLETLAVDFQGNIRPISLELITRALEWPVFQGTLSGEIPRVRLKSGVGLVGGAEAGVFRVGPRGRIGVPGRECQVGRAVRRGVCRCQRERQMTD